MLAGTEDVAREVADYGARGRRVSLAFHSSSSSQTSKFSMLWFKCLQERTCSVDSLLDSFLSSRTSYHSLPSSRTMRRILTSLWTSDIVIPRESPNRRFWLVDTYMYVTDVYVGWLDWREPR